MRFLMWFSCGAASAVATKFFLKDHPEALVCYCDTSKNEHPDNERFIKDCEEYFGKSILRLKSSSYPKMDVEQVLLSHQFINGPFGAPCTKRLKKDVRKEFQLPTDFHAFGYTSDEKIRIERLKESEPDLKFTCPLYNNFISKKDCYTILKEAGIKIARMYELGYVNNNCIGCVKGGKGYWNKIRKDFPSIFWKMAQLEMKIGASCINGTFLFDLKKGEGNYTTDYEPDCGVVCASTLLDDE